MPGWHVQTQRYEEAGQLNVVGIIQEQHPERARLFMQWKQMGWPLMVDSLNLLDVRGAPITLFLDEAGVIQAINPRQKDLERFLAEKPADWDGVVWQAPANRLLLEGPDSNARRLADRQFLWGGTEGLERATEGYLRVLNQTPGDARAHFRLGVAYRTRYDQGGQRGKDFRQAVAHWGKAIEIDPNQYIWRRRIQQYGPRLAKPYSFYDWVHEARRVIRQRGDEPIELGVEPGGAEFANAERDFGSDTSGSKNPDAEGRIFRDVERLIQIEAVAVPHSIQPGEAARIHIRLVPDQERKVHWNNEVEDMILWVEGAEGWQVERQLHRYSIPEQPVSVEPRPLEFEVLAPEGVATDSVMVRGYFLYYICEDVNGQCLYRRQDFAVPIQIRDGKGAE